jgi:membrane-bound metal-dependent hydrolase YbcI (DUF457 family)
LAADPGRARFDDAASRFRGVKERTEVPNVESHLGVAAVASALGVAYGGAALGWDSATSTLAFMAGVSGGLIPDLDHDGSKPLRLSGAVAGLGAAAAVAGFVGSPGGFLNRPWPVHMTLLAFLVAYLVFNTVFIEIFKRRTRHRGLFHSLAVPFLYAGLWASLVSSRGARMTLAVWVFAAGGVLSHLVMDACKSLSMNPLKVAGEDIGASTRLWVLTALINMLAAVRLKF